MKAIEFFTKVVELTDAYGNRSSELANFIATNSSKFDREDAIDWNAFTAANTALVLVWLRVTKNEEMRELIHKASAPREPKKKEPASKKHGDKYHIEIWSPDFRGNEPEDWFLEEPDLGHAILNAWCLSMTGEILHPEQMEFLEGFPAGTVKVDGNEIKNWRKLVEDYLKSWDLEVSFN